jgi:hypothetical protein
MTQQETPQTGKQKSDGSQVKNRVRVRPANTQLQQALDDAKQPGLKISEHRTIQTRLEVLSKMADREAAIERDVELKALTAENETLRAQHAEDARCLAELKTENATLRTKASEVRTITVPDPAALRERNAALMSLLKNFAGKFDSEHKRVVAAVRAIKVSSPAIAKIWCDVIGADYTALVQFLQTHKTEAQLQDVISKAKQRGPAVVMAEAVIAVNDAVNDFDTIASMNFVPVLPEKRDPQRESEEAVRKVAATMGRVEMSVLPQRRDFSEPRTPEENLAMQETAYIGTPGAQQRRERMAPVYPQSQQSRKPISGCAEGADFSEWVL